MNRRNFIQISSAALLPILLGIFPRKRSGKNNYSINVVSNRKFGHLLRASQGKKPTREIETEFIIVGGGVSGVSAALTLKNRDFLLYEAGDRLGGTSACGHWEDTYFAMGAHYELAYPKTFGKDVIDLLKNMNVIEWNPFSELYEFVEKKYVIPERYMEQCYVRGKVESSILSNEEYQNQLAKILEPFHGKMPMPTHLIEEEFQHLNEISFGEYLIGKCAFSEDMARRISYQMLDDWGGTVHDVSALAGIHYYACRPYDQQDVELLSPPNGNAYFIEKMIGHMSKKTDAIHTNSLVRSIREENGYVECEMLNQEGTIDLVRAKGLIYTGKKHALPYILDPQLKLQLNKVEYAPWVVMNIAIEKGTAFGKWQNDVLTENQNFLGFVDSSRQHTQHQKHDVLTAYYCFPAEHRHKLVELEEDPQPFIDATIDLIEEETGKEFASTIKHVNLHFMGHAMPIPTPGYLSFEPVQRCSDRILLAGVDTGRLPLFFEACDSGIQAAKELILSNKQSTL